MPTLSSQIRNYYWDHFAELPESAQFHFANRLAAWTHDAQARTALEVMKSSYVPQSTNELKTQLEALLAEAPRTTMPAYERRMPYFEQYPQLYGLHQALFRVRHLDEIYDVPAAATLAELISPNAVDTLLRELVNDPEALRVLSTIAINTVYLAHRYSLNQSGTIDPTDFFALRNRYDTTDPDELRLLVYLLTHCIIADSNFYARPLSTQYQPVYYAMLDYLEALIDAHFIELSLDTKLEFLVCCNIANRQSSLRSRINTECAASVSPEGTYLVDTHNHYGSLAIKRNFAESEHRNVLYILGQEPYRPRR